MVIRSYNQKQKIQNIRRRNYCCKEGEIEKLVYCNGLLYYIHMYTYIFAYNQMTTINMDTKMDIAYIFIFHVQHRFAL